MSEIEQEVKEEPIEINVGQIIIDDENYPKCAKWCNENGCYIEEIEPTEEGVRQFQIKAPTPKTEEELLIEEAEKEVMELEAQINDIKDRLMYAILLNDTDTIDSLRGEYEELL